MKFRPDKPDELCGHTILDDESQQYGGFACMRIKGHDGPHVSMLSDAGIADGVCWECRTPIPGHDPDCNAGGAKSSNR